MSNYLKEFKFNSPPKKISYLDEEPLKLNENFVFFHNKSKIRGNITRLQEIFKNYIKNPLLALAIRDSYLKEEYTEKFLIILFTTQDIISSTNNIIESYSAVDFEKIHFYLRVTSQYLLLLAKDLKGINEGVDLMEDLFKQVLEDYFDRKDFDSFIKIRPIELIGGINKN
ncbi:MAG: hypothetical protein ACFFEN_10865 [Candidatus Thorarchaeota archaeon]